MTDTATDTAPSATGGTLYEPVDWTGRMAVQAICGRNRVVARLSSPIVVDGVDMLDYAAADGARYAAAFREAFKTLEWPAAPIVGWYAAAVANWPQSAASLLRLPVEAAFQRWPYVTQCGRQVLWDIVSSVLPGGIAAADRQGGRGGRFAATYLSAAMCAFMSRIGDMY